MADQEANENAAKQRIISHMNADHHDSVVRYLEHYSKLSSWAAFDGKMSDINLNGMTFACGHKSYQVPFDPPMKSYRDARERVVEMDQECISALDRSDITIQEFVPPTGLYLLEFFIIASTFLGYSQRWWFAEGQIVEAYAGTLFAKFSWYIQPWLIGAMLVIHVSELAFFVQHKLRRHSVNMRSSVWWQWVVFTFVEGQFSYMRFKELVRRKREHKDKQKH